MNARLRLLRHVVAYDLLRFRRDPQAMFLTVALPVVFLVIFAAIFGNEEVRGRPGLRVSTYYVPGIMTLGVVMASFVSLAIAVVEQRERGTLKRIRATPMPAWAYIAGRVTTSVVLVMLVAVVLTLVGRLLYGVHVPTGALGGVLLNLAVGTGCFCCLGFACTGLIRAANSATAVTNFLTLPLEMLSGVFFPVDQVPDVVLTFAKIFPVYHLANGLLQGYDPNGAPSGIDPVDLVVMAAWGVAGLLVALRTFRWDPQGT